jgi:hypothetical protein
MTEKIRKQTQRPVGIRKHLNKYMTYHKGKYVGYFSTVREAVLALREFKKSGAFFVDNLQADRGNKDGFIKYMKENPHYYKEIWGGLPIEQAWEELESRGTI